ncbi:MAG: LOG family protein [Planctomycetes bacterium]|nr:LOG family protein [Planctomycetota bacterium]
MTQQQKVITIFGTSKAVDDDPVYQQALRIGTALAQNGYIVANGGYGGTMLAAAKGAHLVGGEVIGVTCLAFGRSGANEYVTRQIQTETLPERLNTLVELGNAYIVLAGGTGTLLELAEVWELKNKGFPGTDKPIIIVGPFWQPLIELMASADPGCAGCIRAVEGPDEAIETLKMHF